MNKRADRIISRFEEALMHIQRTMEYEPLNVLIRDLKAPHTQFKQRHVDLMAYHQQCQNLFKVYEKNSTLDRTPEVRTLRHCISELFQSFLRLLDSMIAWFASLFSYRQQHFFAKPKINLKPIDEKIKAFEDELSDLMNEPTYTPHMQ